VGVNGTRAIIFDLFNGSTITEIQAARVHIKAIEISYKDTTCDFLFHYFGTRSAR
jgi:hypothetical protein